MYIVLCKKQASPFRQGDEYHMTIAHHWISEEQTIPTRYGRAVEEPIRRSSAPETGPRLARDTSHSSDIDGFTRARLTARRGADGADARARGLRRGFLSVLVGRDAVHCTRTTHFKVEGTRVEHAHGDRGVAGAGCQAVRPSR
jgi:hypothetical protein